MSATVKLKTLIDEMQDQMDEWSAYFCKKTGEFVSLPDEAFRAAEEMSDEDEMDDEAETASDRFFDVEEDQIELAKDIMDNSDDYVELPSEYDIHEYEIMENFCLSIKDEKVGKLLLIAIKGAGAFRRFKDMISELEVEDDWYKFRDEAYKELAMEWCDDNGLKYEE